jgi:hypothetical protein
MALLEQDDVDVPPRQMESNACAHTPAADDDDLGLSRDVRSDHRAPDGVSPYRGFHFFIVEDG